IRTILCWLTTAIVVSETALGGIWDLLRIDYVRGVIAHLGDPPYLLLIMGVWKVPGAIAIALPRFPRLREWAYAGAFFDYSGAVASHVQVGDGPSIWIAPLIFAAITLASWALRRPAEGEDALPDPASRRRAIVYWAATSILA